MKHINLVLSKFYHTLYLEMHLFNFSKYMCSHGATSFPNLSNFIKISFKSNMHNSLKNTWKSGIYEYYILFVKNCNFKGINTFYKILWKMRSCFRSLKVLSNVYFIFIFYRNYSYIGVFNFQLLSCVLINIWMNESGWG